MSGFVRDVFELDLYKLAFDMQQKIFELSKAFPVEERYSLTDQLRRSSRSIAANICEAWGKRKYEAHFRSKLTDAESERLETIHWLLTARACEYISDSCKHEIIYQLRKIGSIINKMIEQSDKWSKSFN